MNSPDKTAPPAASPEPEDNAGYAETEPRDREDVSKLRNPRPQPNPDDGGLDREPEVDPDPVGHDRK